MDVLASLSKVVPFLELTMVSDVKYLGVATF
jgi:hypothetical protein